MAQTPRLQFRPAALRHLLHDKNGGVGSYFSAKGERIAKRARALVHVRTGKLRASIKSVYRADFKDPAIDVRMGGEGVEYAMAYHEGHREFTLPAKSSDDSPSVYAFEVGGDDVFTRGPITIPRTEGHPVLEIAAREEGFKLRIRRSF